MSGPLRYISEPEQHPYLAAPERSRFSKKRIAIFASAAFVLFLAALYHFVFPPRTFPQDTVIPVEEGGTLTKIAERLAQAKAIKSPFAFKAFVTLFGGSKGLRSGDYYLDLPQNSIILAWRFSHSVYDLQNVKVTIPEGTSVKEIGALVAKDRRFTHFSPSQFASLAAPYEGYLFPDTYLWLPNITAKEVMDSMLANYKNRIGMLASEIRSFGRPIEDVIKMASIVEEEARTDETRRTIAGILWKRLDEGMPLQVDAAFSYVNGKGNSALLTLDDLRIESPYNTYLHKGLPPTPISNPGLNAIRATVTPISTRYYYYLSDSEGNMHYATTHEEHVVNKSRYIP